MKRDALVKKYLPKLKEDVDLDEAPTPGYTRARGSGKNIDPKTAKIIAKMISGDKLTFNFDYGLTTDRINDIKKQGGNPPKGVGPDGGGSLEALMRGLGDTDNDIYLDGPDLVGGDNNTIGKWKGLTIGNMLKKAKIRYEEVDLDEKKKGTAHASLKDVMALDKKNAADKKQAKKDKKRDDANRKSNRAAGMEEVDLDEFTVSDVEIAMKKKYGKVDKEAIEKLKKVQHMGNVDRNALVKVGHGKLHVESVDLDEKLDKEDEPKVKEIIKKLKGASQAHAGQAKDLQKAVTEKDELDEAVDKNAADELKMYIENDAQLYKSQLIPIVKNIQRKMKSGKYDHRKAPKLWMYLVDAAAKKYVRSIHGSGMVKSKFDKQTRQYVAQQMADEYKDEIEAQGGTMFEEVGMDEAYSPKQIKMAIGIASDPRYKGGNYSGAVKAIEKIKGGLSQDKQVAAVLKRQNEALGENLDGRTREYRQHREKLESIRSKRLEARDIDPADIDTSATDDDIKSAGKNIMMQLRKSVSLRGQYSVEFLDKKKVKVPQKIALAVIAKYNSLKKPMDKEKFQAKIAKSHKDLLMGLKESLDEKKKKPVVFKGTPKQIKQQMKNLKKKDKIKIGEESTLERMNKKLQEKKNG